MASSYIKINTSALRNDVKEIDNLVGQLEKKLGDINTGMIALDRKWEGPANETLISQYESDYELFKEVCKMVRNFSAELKNAAGEYERCENAVSDAVRSIRV